VLEACFLYRDTNRAKCRAFAFLLDALLQSLHRQHHVDAALAMPALVARGGELNLLFEATNGFHVEDRHGRTPLSYAAQCGLDSVVEFFALYVMIEKATGAHKKQSSSRRRQRTSSIFKRRNGKDLRGLNSLDSRSPGIKTMARDLASLQYAASNRSWQSPWLFDQDYLHSIVHTLLMTDSERPNRAILKALLNTMRVDVNHYSEPHGGFIAHRVLQYRAQLNTESEGDVRHRQYLLRCLPVLRFHGYDFLSNDNTLQRAVSLGDADAVLLLVEIYENEKLRTHLSSTSNPEPVAENDSESSEKHEELWCLLNDKNERGRTALDLALEMGRADIAEILLETDEQELNIEHLARQLQPIEDEELLNLSDCAKLQSERQHTVHWIVCFAELIDETDAEVLGCIDVETRTELLNIFTKILASMAGELALSALSLLGRLSAEQNPIMFAALRHSIFAIESAAELEPSVDREMSTVKPHRPCLPVLVDFHSQAL